MPALATILVCVPLAAFAALPSSAQEGVEPDPSVDRHALFAAVGSMYGIAPDLLAAIASVESGGRPCAVSSKGALGLMQLKPATAEHFGVADPCDPVESALGAARFIRYLSELHVSGVHRPISLPEVVAAYNAGPNAVMKFSGIPPYRETLQYVRNVLLTYLLDGATAAPDTVSAEPPAHRPCDREARRVDPFEQLAEIRRARAQAGLPGTLTH